MKDYNKAIIITVIFGFLVSLVAALNILPLILWDIIILLYLIILYTWAFWKSYSTKIFNYLIIIFLGMLIVFNLLDNNILDSNILINTTAVFIFDLLCLSLLRGALRKNYKLRR